jgi:meso-butanediol dehydrogenase/(S,S)-butanediol dehydrogenase/diacetyl reductase
MELGLKGKVAIVTGGASGMGTAITESFVKEEANVVIADIDLNAAQMVAQKLGGYGAKVLAIKTNVTEKADADNLVSTTLKEFGRIDILVNDAGAASNILLTELEEEEWDRVNSINTKGIYLVTRAVVPHMIAQRSGKIVSISSLAGKDGIAGQTHYCASKFAVIGFTRALAKEVGEYNINVNAVCPGIVRTPMWPRLLDEMSKRLGISGEQVWDNWVQQAPLKRPCTLEDSHSAVIYQLRCLQEHNR